MRVTAIFVSLLLAAPAVAAEERSAFYGVWGTAPQCAGAPIKPGGTVMAAPTEIGPEWLRQGALWCRLTWLPLQPRDDGVFTGAHAQCGEDSIRDYLLRMELKDGDLMLRWSLFHQTGPFERCPTS